MDEKIWIRMSEFDWKVYIFVACPALKGDKVPPNLVFFAALKIITGKLFLYLD